MNELELVWGVLIGLLLSGSALILLILIVLVNVRVFIECSKVFPQGLIGPLLIAVSLVFGLIWRFERLDVVILSLLALPPPIRLFYYIQSESRNRAYLIQLVVVSIISVVFLYSVGVSIIASHVLR